MTTTHTYAILQVSASTFREIEAALTAAGYASQFHEETGKTVIDMHGIALQQRPNVPACSLCGRTDLVHCPCGALWCDNHPRIGTTCPKCGSPL